MVGKSYVISADQNFEVLLKHHPMRMLQLTFHGLTEVKCQLQFPFEAKGLHGYQLSITSVYIQGFLKEPC